MSVKMKDIPSPPSHCIRCNAGIVLLQQQGTEGRCADCVRLDRFEAILDSFLYRLAGMLAVLCEEKDALE